MPESPVEQLKTQLQSAGGAIESGDHGRTGFNHRLSCPAAAIELVARIFKDCGYFLEMMAGTDCESDLSVTYTFNCFGPVDRAVVTIQVPHGASVPSIGKIFKGAEWNEREAHELIGIEFDNHPNLTPLLLPEDATFFPLRKNFGIPKEIAAAREKLKKKRARAPSAQKTPAGGEPTAKTTPSERRELARRKREERKQPTAGAAVATVDVEVEVEKPAGADAPVDVGTVAQDKPAQRAELPSTAEMTPAERREYARRKREERKRQKAAAEAELTTGITTEAGATSGATSEATAAEAGVAVDVVEAEKVVVTGVPAETEAGTEDRPTQKAELPPTAEMTPAERREYARRKREERQQQKALEKVKGPKETDE